MGMDKVEFMHLTTMPWNHYVTSPDMDRRPHELLKLGSYLEYVVEQSAYEVRAINAAMLAREKHIEKVLSE